MIPLRWLRVLFGFAGVSFFIGLVDELCIWLLSSQLSHQIITGITTGVMVMLLAYHGGSVVRFVLGRKIAEGELVTKISAAITLLRTDLLLVSSTPFPLHRTVLYESKNPAAFTMSDGGSYCIFLSSAMVQKLTEDALACVIAHERGHMMEYHPRKQSLILGLLASVKATTGVTVVAVFIVLLTYLYMLRDWEYIADRRAVSMVGADRLILAFTEFRNISGQKNISRLSELMSSHPSIERRIAAVGRE